MIGTDGFAHARLHAQESFAVMDESEISEAVKTPFDRHKGLIDIQSLSSRHLVEAL
jgi:hypothetical protein